ncbi:hypothetical protein MBLNU459_g1743t1 [Dothideomycetes sp. NU459]
MSAQHARRRSSLSRKLPKQHRDTGTSTSMVLPERFRDMDDDTQDDQGQTKEENPAFMYQSIFGMIAATQTKNHHQSRLQHIWSASEDEADADIEHKSIGQQQKPREESIPKLRDKTPASSARSRPRRELPENKLLRSLPGVKPSPSRDPLQTHAAARSSHPQSHLDTVGSYLLDQDLVGDSGAPITTDGSQPPSHANVTEPLESTIARSSIAIAGPDPTMSPRNVSVGLPEALKGIFQLEESEEVIAEYPCWYLQSVLLQGRMYITQNHVCFYAYLQKKSSAHVKTGWVSKRGKHNPQYFRYWLVLKGDVLTYFTDPSNQYFPSGHVDLRYAVSAELGSGKDKNKEHHSFSVTTDSRTYDFRADSATSANEWVKQLQNVIFRSRNAGDSVKISLPIDNIIDVEETSLLDLAETIKIRVIDNDETFSVDEYFFSFFGHGKDAQSVLQVMSKDTSAQRALSESPLLRPADQRRFSSSRHKRASLSPMPGTIHENVRLTLSPGSMAAPQDTDTSANISQSSLDLERDTEERSHTTLGRGRYESRTKRSGKAASKSFAPRDSSESFATSPELTSQSDTVESLEGTDASGSHILSESIIFHAPTIQKGQAVAHTPSRSVDQRRKGSRDTTRSSSRERDRAQPPPSEPTEHDTATAGVPTTLPKKTNSDGLGLTQSDSSTLGGIVRASAMPIQRASGLAGYITKHGKKVTNLLGTSPYEYYGKVSGMLAGGKKHYSEADGLSADDHVNDLEDDADVLEAGRRFREHFALPESEKLVAAFFGCLHRVLPLYGKIYIGTTKLCFRSLLIGTRTKVVVPFKDILTVDKEKGFRWGYSGMVVVIRGHEEIFFEFGSAGLRDDCTITVLRALDVIKSPQESVTMTEEEKQHAKTAAAENLLLQEARQDEHKPYDLAAPGRSTELDAPTIIFDDPAASVLDFKPQESLRITVLTIGSRGDVQPYIALCKGLLADGHKPKIATHAEFGDWVRKHGIDFAPVEGDPAELMRICVDNGMFTPSFLLEANSKFRGFVSTLLDTAWTACQDSDVLIESPSAMAGIHIAEALSIPYFRAFTMPWTRTRAYPHAFAVPNHKMGGAYNYMTYVLFDNIFWQSMASMVNRWRKQSLGLRSTSMDKLQPNKVPFLYNFSPSVVVPPLDFSEWIRVTGYWFLDEATDWTPKEELLDFIKKSRDDKLKLVYIGFGSVVVPDPKELTQSIVDAVIKANVRCILSKGWSARLDKKSAKVAEVPLPSCIYQIDSAPHDWLFRQVDAVVHHGGAGTTGASLRAGKPTVIRPYFGDQFFFGSRVEDLGVGMQITRVTKNALGKALWIACHDQRMIEKARVLGEQIRSENGVDTAIKAIYRDMEYAKSLIKKREPIGAAEGSADDGESTEEEVEEWTLVENDSDPEATSSPTAMMQQPDMQQSRLSSNKKSGLTYLPLRGR